jgi:transposase
MSNFENNDAFIEHLLQERDAMYGELSRLRKIDQRALEEAENTNKKLNSIIEEKDVKIRQLTDQLAWYKRKFWKPTTEKYIPQDPNQCRIDFDGLDMLPEEKAYAQEAEKEVISYERNKPKKEKKQPVRMPLPDHLRRETEVIEPDGIDENWIRINEEVTEVLNMKPGELFVRCIVRPVYALKKALLQLPDSEQEFGKSIRIASLPDNLPLKRSNADASLLADLELGKYLFHLPFHRQIAIYKQLGVSISKSTINGWHKDTCDLLRALYYRLKEIVLSSDYIQVDESTIPVISNEKQRAAKEYLWVVRAVIERLVFFHYDKGSRAQKVIVELLHDFKGAVQSDGYGAYSIYENKMGVLLLGCWAHARRKFVEAEKEDKSGAEYALGQISLLYKVETMADEQNLDDQQRAELRKRLAYPILQAFEKWIESYYPKALPKGRMERALRYTYSIFRRLSRYQLDGRYKLDNNLIENSIRGMAIGRKNYLFCGNHDSAENAAIMYSLIETCKAQDVNPREWLTDVLTKIPVYNNDYSLDLADLLPHNWKKARQCQPVSD